MKTTKLVLSRYVFAVTLTIAGIGNSLAAEFSPEAVALPFPPDAQGLKFDARFGDIEYTSQSPLMSLAAFYLKEMAARGWEHDESAAKVDKDAIKLTFKHGNTEVKIDFKQWSKEVRISLDCKNVQFTGTDDPEKLAAAGLPVPPAVLFLHKEVPLPDGIQQLKYTGDGAQFQSPMKLRESFDHFSRLIQSKGFRESRKPILTDTRRYTEFKKGTAEFSVNVFTHEIGSRLVLTYKDASPARPVPPLAAVASLPIQGGPAAGKGGSDAPVAASATPIDVAANKGSATVNYNGKQYTFANVASFQTKNRGADATMVVFSAKPIPLAKMQSLIASQDDFSFGDLYEFSVPERLILQLGNYPSFTFALSNLTVGRPVEQPTGEIKVSSGRVQGSLKMPPVEAFKGEQLSFTATADAVIMTPSTRLSGPGGAAASDPVLKSDSPILADAPVPFPDGVNDVSREGTKFFKTYRAVVSMPLAEVAAFYSKELAGKGWTQPETGSTGGTMQLKSDALEASLTLKPQGNKTAIEAVKRDVALAKQQGILPEPGKGRLVLGNANNVAVTFTIGKSNYPLKPGQGEKDYKQALNYSLAPGTYTVILKVPGQAQETEKIELTAGTAWGIIALPMGGCLPVQLY